MPREAVVALRLTPVRAESVNAADAATAAAAAAVAAAGLRGEPKDFRNTVITVMVLLASAFSSPRTQVNLCRE